jgi:TRAP-type C4-dicarboxylate transport system permease small subunit
MSPAADRKTPFEAAVARLSFAFGAVGGAILVAILLIIAVGVMMRYAFNNPVSWADQVATYGLVYLTFIGAPRVLARRRHVAVDLLHSALPHRPRQLLDVLLGAVGTAYCLAFTFLAAQEFARVIARGSEFSDAFTLPQWAVYLVIPLGAALLSLQYFANFIADFRTWRNAAKNP